ncbi:hypothetical protein KM043_011944 [Ampulex compressa]|nr:hypothetical protein KM043_011944 [Ampulex compressa]
MSKENLNTTNDRKSSSSSLSSTRSPHQRKETLRNFIARTEVLQENVNDKTIHDLQQFMDEADNINLETSLDEKINNQEEVVLDSKMMNISSKVLTRCTRSLTNSMCAYDYVEFAEKLIQYVNQLADTETETPNWSLLEQQVTKCFKITPSYSVLLGALEPIPEKEISKKKPHVKEGQVQVKNPEKIMAINKEEKSVEETVDKIRRIITRYCKTHHKPLDFFRLILHPTDFGKTVENILYTSFLVRDGNVKLIKNESGVLVIQLSSKEMISQAKKAEKSINIQNVMTLNMEQWRVLKDTYNLKKPMIDFENENV